MIKYVKVRPYNGLRAPTKFPVGKVTAICGRNGSGKSTLLEAMAQADGFEAGVDSGEVAERLVTTMIQALGQQGHLDYHLRQLRPRFDRLIERHPVSYPSEADEAMSAVRTIFMENGGFGRISPNVQFFREQFRTLFPKRPTISLLPVKRLVQTSVALQPSELLSPSGAGLLNNLFFLSAQPARTEERELFERIHGKFVELTDGVEPVLRPNRENVLQLFFRRTGGDLVPAHQSGQGLIDLLVTLRFALGPEADLVLIEEPELHIHADLQRRTNILLQEIPDKQFLLATHSNIYLHPQVSDVVLVARYDAGVTIANGTSRAELLTELGYSAGDNLTADAVLLTEGPYDGEAYRTMLRVLGATPKAQFRTWPLGGDIMDKLDLEVLASQYKVVAIVDRDPKSSRVRRRFARRCAELNIPCHILKKRSIEYYFSAKTIRKVFPNAPSTMVEELDERVKVDDQLGFSLKKSLHKLAEEMSPSDLEGTDLSTILRATAAHFDS